MAETVNKIGKRTYIQNVSEADGVYSVTVALDDEARTPVYAAGGFNSELAAVSAAHKRTQAYHDRN